MPPTRRRQRPVSRVSDLISDRRAGTVVDMLIEVVQADITTVEADVVVTAANRPLIGGGGVDGAVHRVAGPELLQALRLLAPCPVGAAVITPAFNFPPPVQHIVPRRQDRPLLGTGARAGVMKTSCVPDSGVAARDRVVVDDDAVTA